MDKLSEHFVSTKLDYFYNELDLNCAEASLKVLSEAFDFDLGQQLFDSASGMNGAGQFRAQCGLVEGPLMFMGAYLRSKQLSKDLVKISCQTFAKEFEANFGSLLCRDLRPNGFNENDLPYLCSGLSLKAIVFTLNYVSTLDL